MSQKNTRDMTIDTGDMESNANILQTFYENASGVVDPDREKNLALDNTIMNDINGYVKEKVIMYENGECCNASSISKDDTFL